MPGPLAKLDHCVIHVSDWAASNPFYRDVLGAELVDRGHGTWAYRFGTEQLNVHGPGVVAEPVARVPVARENSDLSFEWDDRNEVYPSLTTAPTYTPNAINAATGVPPAGV